jgi:hypothetical protein
MFCMIFCAQTFYFAIAAMPYACNGPMLRSIYRLPQLFLYENYLLYLTKNGVLTFT